MTSIFEPQVRKLFKIKKMPLTASGKIDRQKLSEVDKEFILIEQEDQVNLSVADTLVAIWSDVLRLDQVGIHDNFFKIGGDSIISIQIVAKARNQGIHLTVKDIFNYPTIAQLSLIIKQDHSTEYLQPSQELVTGNIPLTPIQSWFFDQKLPYIHHYNQAVLLALESTVDIQAIRQSISFLLNHHDILRSRYQFDSQTAQWSQSALPYEDINLILGQIDLSSVSDDNLPSNIEFHANKTQESLNIHSGPLMKAILFQCGDHRPSQFLIVIHHLVVDGVSWRIILDDLQLAYKSYQQNQTPSTPHKTHSFQQWAQELQDYALSDELLHQVTYWESVQKLVSNTSLPIDITKNQSILTAKHFHTAHASLSTEQTQALINKVPSAYRTQINDILLTALVLTIGEWSGQYQLCLELEGHGREDIIPGIDLSRTVGWFTSLFPVCLQINDPQDLGESIKTIKESIRQIPHKGIGYGILTHINPSNPLSKKKHISPSPTLCFNYLGQWDNTMESWGYSAYNSGNAISTHNQLLHLINVNCEIRDQVFQVFWNMSTVHYDPGTCHTLAHTFIQILDQLIQHCSQDQNFGYTVSDFELSKNRRNTLNRLKILGGLLNVDGKQKN